MSNVTTKDSLAKIAISKNLIKEYKTPESERTVYLDNGTEFQIYLKNPYQSHLGVKIYVNDKSIGNMLVLRPGQSYWLDRFIDSDDKLLFSTYEVENSAEMKYAVAKNGKVKVEFYHERETQVSIRWDNSCLNTYINSSDIIPTSSSVNYVTNSATTCFNGSSTYLYNNPNVVCKSLGATDIDMSAMKELTKSTMETGRIEKGSKSDQKFENCYVNFDYLPFSTEHIQILPNSRKQVHAEEKRRKYCSQCGKKVSPKDKFCSNCGAKL